MACVYILLCKEGSLYVGSTGRDPVARVEEHNLGLGSRYTRRPGRRPVELLWVESYDAVEDAFDREKQIQGWGRAKRLALIEGRVGDLPGLARSRGAR